MKKSITLYRPVGHNELKLIKDSGLKEFPPRLPEQPIFYPVLTEEYAIKIARDWNCKTKGKGYVTKFQVDSQFLSNYPIQNAGGKDHQEYWIPAEEITLFNQAIKGKIKLIHTFEKWYVYIIECNDKTLYTGITNNLDARIKKHNENKGARYTKGRTPVKLLKSFDCQSKNKALRLEYQIKQLSREEKLNYKQNKE